MQYIITFLLLVSVSFQAVAIDTKASEAIVLDYNTQEVIFEKDADKLTLPASLTKIMTVYIVFDRIRNTNLSINDKCTVSAKAYRMKGSKTFLEINEKVSISDLLRGIIIQSGNDASVTIAECLSGTEDDFSILMNSYSDILGLKNTHFTNASGWPDEKHYSSVRDMAILSNALIRDFPDLYTYFQEKEFTYNGIYQPNRNKLLEDVDGVDGLKTGYLKKSGWGIAVSAIRKDRRIIVVLNGANSSRIRLLESEKLLNWAFRETTQKKILFKDQIIKEVDVWLGSKPTINLIVNEDVITILSFEQLKTIKSTIEYEKPISVPIKAGDNLGKMIIEVSGKQNIEVPLVAEKNINNINPILRVFSAIKYLIFGTSLDE
tara:strand:- start:131 stop:1258 length:1128 start_codon:yes stop_codon:yes gene_type:complete